MITNYIDYLRHIAGYAANTCAAYERDLKSFAVWAGAHTEGKRWSMIEQADVERYIQALSMQGYNATTTNRALSAIRSIYRYWQRQGMIANNPAKNVLPRKEEITIPMTIDKVNLQKIHAVADDELKLIISILYTTGIRVQELLDMRWQDVNLNTGAIVIHGKGSEQRIVYVGTGISDKLSERKLHDNWRGAIFCHSQRTIRRMMSEAAKLAGVECNLSPHILRHTAATEWAVSGANSQQIAKALGHHRIETSKKYIDLTRIDTRCLMVGKSVN